MEKRLVLRGVAAGALAGLVAFIFARIFVEPVIQAAINYERGRDAAQDALNKAAGLPTAAAGPDIFSRGVQRNVGIGVGLVLFGIAMGCLFAVVYYFLARRNESVSPRLLALLVAGAGFVGVFFVPFLKYPSNPPAIGHPETIYARGPLYLAMVAISVLAVCLAVAGALWLWRRLGPWDASLIAFGGFVVVVGVAIAILPPLGHLHANVVVYGKHLTETPLPLKDPQGQIVYPGFPADVLVQFRLYSIINQLVLWGVIGLTFGGMVARLPGGTSSLNREAASTV